MNKSEKSDFSKVFSYASLVILDILCLVLIYTALVYFRYKEEGVELFYGPSAIGIMLLVTLFHLFIIGGYHQSTNMISLRFMGEYLITLLVNLLICIVVLFFVIEAPAARAIVAVTLLIFPALSLVYRRWFYSSRMSHMHKRSIYVLGSGSMAQELYQSVCYYALPNNIEFFDLTNKKEGKHLIEGETASPVIKGDFLNAFRENKDDVDLIIIALEQDEIPDSLLEWLISKHFIDVRVQTLGAFYSDQWKIISLSNVSPYWVFEEGFLLKTTLSFERTKRLFDVVMASVMLVSLLPVCLLLMIAIRIDSDGPVMFKQTRVGRNQKKFSIFKFRSMYSGSDRGDKYTQPNDARITAIGSFMRKSRLDEIPQLMNVIMGHMSLVGPRPEWDELVDRYEQKIPYYHYRHLVKPGITGWAQVNYSYGASSDDAIEKLKYDLYYVRHYSFFLDLTIGLKTIYVIFFGKGR